MHLNHITILISAKNEAGNISSLFNSLKNVDYPLDNFEIILVNDNSTDLTGSKAESYKDDFPNLKILKAENKKYPGKKGALDLGIKNAINEYILITDADCTVSHCWLKRYSDKFNEGYDFLFGNAPFIKQTGLANSIARFENLRSFFLYTTAYKLNIPYSASARNFGFKKSSFNKINGYYNTNETISGDDDLLIREAVKNNMKIGFIPDKDASVYSCTPASIKDYLVQKTRHTKTSLYYLPVHKLFFGSWHLINIALWLTLILGFYNKLFFIPLIIKIVADLIIVKTNEGKSNYRFGLLEIVYLQILYEIFIVINFVNALFREDKWK